MLTVRNKPWMVEATTRTVSTFQKAMATTTATTAVAMNKDRKLN